MKRVGGSGWYRFGLLGRLKSWVSCLARVVGRGLRRPLVGLFVLTCVPLP